MLLNKKWLFHISEELPEMCFVKKEFVTVLVSLIILEVSTEFFVLKIFHLS
jgi:hypothetical protein